MKTAIVLYIVSAILYIGMPIKHLLNPTAFSNKTDLLYFLPVFIIAMLFHYNAMDKRFEKEGDNENE